MAQERVSLDSVFSRPGPGRRQRRALAACALALAAGACGGQGATDVELVAGEPSEPTTPPPQPLTPDQPSPETTEPRRYVGATIGIHNPAGEKVGRVSHVRNTEYVVVAGDLTARQRRALRSLAVTE